MFWVAIQAARVRILNKLAKVHHAYVVAYMLYDSEVMRDKKKRNTVFSLQAGNDIQYLRLHGNIKGRNGLVGNDKTGI